MTSQPAVRHAVVRPPADVDPQVLAERITAARSLLRTPLITVHSRNADELGLIRRHRVELTRLFADGVGYRLHVDPTVRGCSRRDWAVTRAGHCAAGPGSPLLPGRMRCCA